MNKSVILEELQHRLNEWLPTQIDKWNYFFPGKFSIENKWSHIVYEPPGRTYTAGGGWILRIYHNLTPIISRRQLMFIEGKVPNPWGTPGKIRIYDRFAANDVGIFYNVDETMEYIKDAIDDDIKNEWTYQMSKKIGEHKAASAFTKKSNEYEAIKNTSSKTFDTFKDFLGNL